jgi:thiamine-monophosphate kinase
MRVSSIGEFGAIARIKEASGKPGRDVTVGIGDDAAAVRPGEDGLVLATTDMLLEGVHFELAYTTFRQLGYKALAVNVSDIAAMGGRPRHYLVSLALSPRTRVEDLDALVRGMEDAGKEYGAALIGGDTCSSPGPLVISITLLGTVKEGGAALRRGARPGDDIYVTGALGDSAAGLDILKAGGRWKRSGTRSYLVSRHLTPTPRAAAGRLLGEGGLASSMIDVSDGFSSDLMHILEESGVGAVVHPENLPVSGELLKYAGAAGALKYALHGGEDYELIFTARPGASEDVKALEKKAGTAFTLIGRVTREKGALLESKGGGRRALRPKGYEHFRK